MKTGSKSEILEKLKEFIELAENDKLKGISAIVVLDEGTAIYQATIDNHSHILAELYAMYYIRDFLNKKLKKYIEKETGRPIESGVRNMDELKKYMERLVGETLENVSDNASDIVTH